MCSLNAIFYALGLSTDYWTLLVWRHFAPDLCIGNICISLGPTFVCFTHPATWSFSSVPSSISYVVEIENGCQAKSFFAHIPRVALRVPPLTSKPNFFANLILPWMRNQGVVLLIPKGCQKQNAGKIYGYLAFNNNNDNNENVPKIFLWCLFVKCVHIVLKIFWRGSGFPDVGKVKCSSMLKLCKLK